MRTLHARHLDRVRGAQRPALLGRPRSEPGADRTSRETLMGIRLLRRPVGRDQMRARIERERANTWLLRVGTTRSRSG